MVDDGSEVEFRDVAPAIGGAVIIALLGIAVLVALFLPAIQAVLYGLLIQSPHLIQYGVLSVLLAGVLIRRGMNPFMALQAALVVFLVFGTVIGGITAGVYAHEDMADQMQSNAEELETLPNTSKTNLRVLPRTVADNYAQSSMQYPQYRLSESDIAYRNGTYVWSYALIPDNFMVSVLGHQTGALYVDMTKTNKAVSVDRTTFKNGRGQLLFDSYRYQSVLQSPLKQHNWDTTFNAKHENTSYIAHSTTEHVWKFRLFPIPQVYSVPRHGSVEVMSPSGEIDTLSPRQARNDPRLQGQNFYPYHLAEFKVNSMKYKHGALNKWFWKEDVLAIADLPEEGNSWPLVVPTEEGGLTYFIATEPTGSGNGVYEIWTFNGQTGAAGVQQYNESQIGPQKAVDFVERHPQVNRLSSARPVSPIPIVKGDTLYWHVKVVPKSLSGVTYTGFVNAETGDVTLVEGTEPIYAFVRKGEVDEIQNQQNGTSSGMSVTVVVVNKNGTVVGTENITVPKGGETRITVNDTANETSTATG